MSERRTFAYYQDMTKNKIKTETSSLFSVLASAVGFGRLATFLF